MESVCSIDYKVAPLPVKKKTPRFTIGKKKATGGPKDRIISSWSISYSSNTTPTKNPYNKQHTKQVKSNYLTPPKVSENSFIDSVASQSIARNVSDFTKHIGGST